MAEQALVVAKSQQYCILSFPKFAPQVLWGRRSSVSFPIIYSKIRGRFKACLASKTNQKVERQLAGFPSDIWKDSNAFTSVASRICDFDQTYGNQIQELKDKVKEMLTAPTNDPREKVYLINSLYRLGISYHFEDDIDQQLSRIFEKQLNYIDDHEYDLYTTALLFRVFRMNGYKMSCDVFNKFKEGDGKFKKYLTNDARGMLSLYEASYLRINGEDILDEALAFTKAHLNSLCEKSSPHLKTKIIKALKMPLNKRIPRQEAVEYISVYEEEESRDETLLLFAKLDFNRVQLLHQQEISHLISWWKDTNLVSDLPYIRDRIVEDYVWGIGTYFEPCHSRARVIWTKIVMLLSVMDDTYDAYTYENIEELQLFTDAIERWDTSALDQMPDYLKTVYSALLNLFDDINVELTEEERSYRVSYTKDTVKEMMRSYHVQEEWFNQNYVPPFDEYLDAAVVSAGCFSITALTFLGMGEMVGIDAFEWISTRPKIIRAGYIIIRLLNDVIGHQFEQKRGHVVSGVESYMNQYGVSRKEAIEKINIVIEMAWKDINEECLKPTAISLQLLLTVINGVRAAEFFYKDGDGYTFPQYLKDHITQLFVDPIPI
ncbi:hypothetical protein ACOSQ2_009848 [Xanthoceras sorbifolium]